MNRPDAALHATLTVLLLVRIGIFGTVGGYLLWIFGVKQLGAANASLFFNFVPVFAVLIAIAFGQNVSPLQLLGISIVIAGLLLPRIAKWQKERLINHSKTNVL